MRRIAIYPGSFDPVTNGHLDIIQRGVHLFDELIVAVSESSRKTLSFSLNDRTTFLRKALHRFPRIRVEPFSGLLADFVKKKKACAVIRGLRAVSDFEYEFQMALMNRKLYSALETFFLMASGKFFYVNSTLIKEVFSHGGDVSGLVPEHVEKRLKDKLCLH